MRFFACVLLAGVAAAHPDQSPPVWLDIVVEEGAARLVVTLKRDALAAWVGLEVPPDDPLPEEAADELDMALVMVLRAKVDVAIDGATVAPRVTGGLARPDDLEPDHAYAYLRTTYRYPCDGVPKRVRVTWGAFDGTEWNERRQIPFLAKHAGHVDLHAFSEEEPEYTWHAPRDRPPPPRPVADPPREPEGLPVAALAFGLVGAGFLLARRPAPAIVCLAVAPFLWGVGRADAVPLPAPAQARTIFATLHGNIYRAFDAGTEEEIYDLLAVSVDESLLDGLYGEVYESLILREDGGAVAKVEKVETVDGAVRLPDAGDVPRFTVDWTWQVHCLVSHWGHIHRRRNEYAARFTVRHDGQSWKIAGIDVTEHRRVDLDEDGREIER